MEIKILHLGLIRTNCYLLSTKKAAIVIDPGFSRDSTLEFLLNNSDKERLILLTHAHFDHIGGAAQLRAATGVPIGIGKDDNYALSDTEINLSDQFHAHIEPFSADRLFSDGEKITVGDIEISVLSTPGHTKGEVCYLTDEKLFSGDTLFAGSIGRTDFKGGDLKTLKKSIKKIMSLPDGVKVYPGHGEFTTIGFERENNMFVW